jgi:hypothetical protein
MNSILYSMSFFDPPGSPIWTMTGNFKYYRAIFSTRGSMVAENICIVL